MLEVHTAIIGAGSAGITVAVGLSGFGKKVALIEKKAVGGDCTNVGCVPSKTLIHLANHMRDKGLSPAEIFEQVRQRRDHLRDEETEEMRHLDGVTLLEGEAVFSDPHTLNVSLDNGEMEAVRAEHVVLASGSAPVIIPIEGLPEEKALTNESLFDLQNLPAHLAIVGAGVIGCEMAFAFRTLGSEVSLIDLAPRILSVLEPEVSELMQARLEAAGVKVYLNAKGDHYKDECGTLVLDQDGEQIDLKDVNKVLIAIGRKPNLDFGLDKAGVETNKRGVPTNHYGKTNVPHIYAIGDINLNSAFTHSANAQGRRLVQKIALPFLPIGKEPTYPSATFTDPEIAQVGPTLEELKKQYHPELIKTYRVGLKETDRAYTQGLEQGFVLIHALRLTGRVLSATIVAPVASEMIAPLTLAVNGGPSMYKLANLVFPYPVLSEAIKKAASSYTFETLPKLHEEALVYLRYRWAKPTQKEA